ncbi:VWA domain-containing protein [Defluviimonas sp. WL0002]|uniref:VWA domain-containing protein n=1 Tax=Albidovulum marisflavi TaxID=2984159 RepID=A0ABT2ZED7_9RHOB|nr:VWA domain-containing protein [Defluviimonas sp. WL0002]MCV2869377.1 VWA domain-containing protein [Defluviimonas sp. WL0002]
MTDDLEKLRAGLKSLHPVPDQTAKAKALARAMESFDRAQETADARRPISDRPKRAGFLTGVREMLTKLTTRPALTMTASLAALAVALTIYPQLRTEAPMPTASQPRPATAPADGTMTGATTQLDDTVLSEAEKSVAPQSAERTESDAAEAFAVGEPAMEMAPQAQLRAPVEGLAASGLSSEAQPAPPAAPPPTLGAKRIAPDVIAPMPEADTETFANADRNPVKVTVEDPVSTFSIDTDTAAWAVLRSSISSGYLPDPAAVRIEEMVNYFPYDYAAPEAGTAPFRAAVSLFQTPWNADTRLLRIGIQGALPATDDRPPLNLVFLIDTSGSMQDANKLPLLKQSLRLMLSELRPEDRIAIVTYAGSAGQVLEATAASDRGQILAALDRLDAGGSTAGAEGLALAYRVAETMGGDGHVGRILLATDGDFNVGISDPEELKDFVAAKRDGGIYLSVLGFGRGNLDDATMQALAQNGNGTAAYIDTLSEAQKVLVDQLSGALFPIANDVKIQVEFNPAAVAEYRLIGYETRALAREDFNNDKVDAGEIGAGHQVTALYEVTPVGSPAILNDPLRYGLTPVQGDAGELGFLKLRYKEPGKNASVLIETRIPAAMDNADDDARFAAAVAGMGQLLTGARYLGDWGWDDAISLANGAKGEDSFGYRAEAVQLMRLAQSLARQ